MTTNKTFDNTMKTFGTNQGSFILPGQMSNLLRDGPEILFQNSKVVRDSSHNQYKKPTRKEEKLIKASKSQRDSTNHLKMKEKASQKMPLKDITQMILNNI
jgi:hypothetical protein